MGYTELAEPEVHLSSSLQNPMVEIGFFYYDNGNRIAFHGYPAGDDKQYDIWSIDANGGDLQRISDAQYNVFLQFVWDP